MFLIYLFAFFIFLFIGSFFGVLIDRIYRGEQFVHGHSYCESCKHQLQTLDLVPLFSYLFLGGKCRYCKAKIPWWLPLTELITATTLTTVLFFVNNSPAPFVKVFFNPPYPVLNLAEIIVALVIASVFILIFITDAKYMVIPDVYLYALALLYPLYFAFFKLQFTTIQNWTIFKDDLIAAAILALFFAAIHYGSRKRAMGDGDIYLAAIIGLYLGTQLSLVMWFMAFLTGAVFGVILLLSKKKKMKSAVPFGPFLILGMVIAILYGSNLLNLYLSI
jgi:prepilin signal peptidase PulO-like enzyme (type II secretory pathway)